MILHTLNKPPSNVALHQDISQTLDKIDSLLLLEDGVYHLSSTQLVKHFVSVKRLYAIKDDVLARGICTTDLPEHVSLITYDDFVALCLTHDKVLSWY